MSTKPTYPAAPVSTLEWHNPLTDPPPFNEPLLLAFGSFVSRGGPFEAHITITTGRVMQEDADGSEDAGEEMVADYNSGACGWADLQFRVVDDDDEEMSTYSDSIMWWAEIPTLPDNRAKVAA